MLNPNPLATVRESEVTPEHVATVLVTWPGVAIDAAPTEVSLGPTAITIPPVAPPRIVVHGISEGDYAFS